MLSNECVIVYHTEEKERESATVMHNNAVCKFA